MPELMGFIRHGEELLLDSTHNSSKGNSPSSASSIKAVFVDCVGPSFDQASLLGQDTQNDVRMIINDGLPSYCIEPFGTKFKCVCRFTLSCTRCVATSDCLVSRSSPPSQQGLPHYLTLSRFLSHHLNPPHRHPSVCLLLAK